MSSGKKVQSSSPRSVMCWDSVSVSASRMTLARWRWGISMVVARIASW